MRLTSGELAATADIDKLFDSVNAEFRSDDEYIEPEEEIDPMAELFLAGCVVEEVQADPTPVDSTAPAGLLVQLSLF